MYIYFYFFTKKSKQTIIKRSRTTVRLYESQSERFQPWTVPSAPRLPACIIYELRVWTATDVEQSNAADRTRRNDIERAWFLKRTRTPNTRDTGWRLSTRHSTVDRRACTESTRAEIPPSRRPPPLRSGATVNGVYRPLAMPRRHPPPCHRRRRLQSILSWILNRDSSKTFSVIIRRTGRSDTRVLISSVLVYYLFPPPPFDSQTSSPYFSRRTNTLSSRRRLQLPPFPFQRASMVWCPYQPYWPGPFVFPFSRTTDDRQHAPRRRYGIPGEQEVAVPGIVCPR